MRNRIVAMFTMFCFVVLCSAAYSMAKAKKDDKPAETASDSAVTKTRKRTNKVSELLKEMNSKKFYVYADKGAKVNHYIPSGYMGDYGDIKVYDNWKEKPQSGTSCIKTVYNNKASQGNAWAGVYWQNPANNWGTRPGGFDITGAKRVTFYARGESGGELISEFKVGGISGGDYADSDATSLYDVELTKEWKKYTIDLADLDLSYISGGFCWAANLDSNPDGITFYLDEICYEF